jgi:hypothetical protein
MIDGCPYPPPRTAEQIAHESGYLYFVYEREAIRLAREVELPREQWTQDEVFRRYKFTNIHRRDDRLSRWLISSVLLPNREDGNLWFTALICRLINWPPTIQALLTAGVIPCAPQDFDAEAFVRVVETCKLTQSKVYGEAYLVYPTKQDPGGVKSRSMAKHIIGSAVENRKLISAEVWGYEPSVACVVDALSDCFGISTFLAGQVAADLTYLPEQLAGAKDLYTWAPLGPGSQQGLNYLYGYKKFHTWKQHDFNSTLSEMLSKIRRELEIEDLTLHDVQNTMCEYSKYARAVLGHQRPKTLYKPQTAY